MEEKTRSEHVKTSLGYSAPSAAIAGALAIIINHFYPMSAEVMAAVGVVLTPIANALLSYLKH